MPELGHACTLTQTNTRSWIAVCECGWYGIAHPRYAGTLPKNARERERDEWAQENATAEHATHCEEIGREIAREHEAALVAHGQYLAAVAPIVTRRGRWGRG